MLGGLEAASSGAKLTSGLRPLTTATAANGDDDVIKSKLFYSPALLLPEARLSPSHILYLLLLSYPLSVHSATTAAPCPYTPPYSYPSFPPAPGPEPQATTAHQERNKVPSRVHHSFRMKHIPAAFRLVLFVFSANNSLRKEAATPRPSLRDPSTSCPLIGAILKFLTPNIHAI